VNVIEYCELDTVFLEDDASLPSLLQLELVDGPTSEDHSDVDVTPSSWWFVHLN
jgi:hypothetical protein